MLYKLKQCMLQKSGKLSWGWEAIPLFTRFYTALRWLAGFLNHQQYFVSIVLMFGYLQFQRLIGVATLTVWPQKRSKSTQIWWVKRSIFIPHLPVPYICLVVEPTHPKKYAPQIGNLPQFSGWNKKKRNHHPEMFGTRGRSLPDIFSQVWQLKSSKIRRELEDQDMKNWPTWNT